MKAAVLAVVFCLGALLPCAPVQAITDLDIAVFAWNLECLEAQFYSIAQSGRQLSARDSGGSRVIGGNIVNFTAPYGYVKSYANKIARDEITHVKFLKQVLEKNGLRAICPTINLRDSFNTLATAAKIPTPFNPFAGNGLAFLLGSFVFEDVGVTAYLGAAPAIVDKGILAAAGGILAVEAYHAGAIRSTLTNIARVQVAPGLTVTQAVDRIAAVREALGGANTDGGLFTDNGRYANLAPVDANAIAHPRTVAQVTSIVTAGGAGGRGLFFPEGLMNVTSLRAPAGRKLA